MYILYCTCTVPLPVPFDLTPNVFLVLAKTKATNLIQFSLVLNDRESLVCLESLTETVDY